MEKVRERRRTEGARGSREQRTWPATVDEIRKWKASGKARRLEGRIGASSGRGKNGGIKSKDRNAGLAEE